METPALFQASHIEAYEATDGRVGHEWMPGLFTLVLTTIGRTIGADRFRVVARTAEAEEREGLWPLLVETFPTFAEYQAGTSRVIPVVVLTPVAERSHPDPSPKGNA